MYARCRLTVAPVSRLRAPGSPRRMKWILLALAAAAGAFWFWRRRSGEEPWEQPWPGEAATEASAGSAAEPPTTGGPAPMEVETPPESAPAEEADPATREMESRRDDETKYERELESEMEERQQSAGRLRSDPLTERLEGGESPRDTSA